MKKEKTIANEIKKEETVQIDENEIATEKHDDSKSSSASSSKLSYDAEKEDPISKILEINELKERGIITQEEFDSLKKKIIGSV